MKLLSVRVEDFRTISQKIDLDIDPEITVLMGANESGKTNILHSIYKFNRCKIFRE